MINKEVHYVRKGHLGRRFRVCQFGVAIRDEQDILVLLRRFRKWSKDIYPDEFEGSGCWKKLTFGHMSVYRIIPFATLAFLDYAFNIRSHVRPEKLVFQRIIYATMAGESRKWWMI